MNWVCKFIKVFLWVLGMLCLLNASAIAQEEEFDIDQLLEEEFEVSLQEEPVYDPLEPVNRVFFQINDTLYFYAFKPIKIGYSAVLPYDLRVMLGNFFYNIASPTRLINNLLQGEFGDAFDVLARFSINTTIGVMGFGDPAAKDFGFEPKPADFGETLGKWGVGEGIYVCWPVFGPSNLRDTVGIAGDVYTHPMSFVHTEPIQNIAYYTEVRVNSESLQASVYEEMKEISIDPYVSVRRAYSDFRRERIDGGAAKQD